MKTNRVLLVMLLATGMIWACNKEDTDNDPATPPPASTANVFDALIEDNIADATQSYAVNNGWGGQIVAQHGTELNFIPGAFVHMDGSPVTGVVEIALVEVLTIGDMIWYNKQTVGDDNGTLRLLRSGGALSIEVSQGGTPLTVNPGGLVVNVPTIVGDPAMELFSGEEEADGRMIWSPVPAPVAVIPAYIDLFYSFSPDSLGWINCDYFYSFPNLTQITSTIPAGQSTDSTQVWLAFPSLNMVVQMPHLSGQDYTSPLSYSGVPVGYPFVIVGLRQSSGGYFSSFTSGTITAEMNVPMTFSPTTLAAFEAAIDNI